jgi:hypothetical protein
VPFLASPDQLKGDFQLKGDVPLAGGEVNAMRRKGRFERGCQTFFRIDFLELRLNAYAAAVPPFRRC